MIGAIALVALLLIAGSGGGGGGGGGASSSSTSASNNPGWKKLSDSEASDQSLVNSFETDEYKKNPILTSINASKAYAELRKNDILNIAGSGVVVGVGVASKQGVNAVVNGANFNHSLINGVAADNHYVLSSPSATLSSGSRTTQQITDATLDTNGNSICSSRSCYFSSTDNATTTSVLNSINIISGIKSSISGGIATDAHGIAYNSKISEVFNVYTQTSGSTIRSYYDNSSLANHKTGFESFKASIYNSQNTNPYFKIYNYIENYNIPSSTVISDSDKEKFKSSNITAQQHDILIILSSGNPSTISGNEDYYSKVSKSFSNSDAQANSNIIFAAPLYIDGGQYKSLPIYDRTNTLFNNCGQSNQAYCLGVNVGSLSSYKYLSNNNSSYNGDKFMTTVGGTDEYPENINLAQSAVSGAAAVLSGAWPQLSSTAIRDILFESADRPDAFGSYGTVSSLENGAKTHTVYGRGILNLYKAVSSYGTKSLSTGSSALSASLYTVDDTSFKSSPIFGDAFASNVAPQVDQAIYYDKYGRNFKAFLGDKFSNTTQTNSFSLNNFAFNNINNNSKSINFGENNDFQLRFNQTQFKDQNAQNNLGLKYAVIDRAVNQQANLNNNSGFAFNFNPQAFDKKISVGFAHNLNEIDNQDAKNFGTSGFLNQGSSFNSNPYQSFLNSSNNLAFNENQNNLSVRKFNQLFASQKIIDDKVDLKFSYQSSYNTSSANYVSTGNKQNEVLNFGIDLKPNKSNKISISTGELREFDNNALNSKASGAFTSQGNSRTSYAKITTSQNIVDHLNLTSTYAQGITYLKGNDQGIFQKYSDIHSKSLSFALQYDGFEDSKFGVAYSEPMRVYKGSVNYKIPVAIDSNMNLIHKEGTASLAPKGKQRDYEFFYQKNLNKNSQLRLNLMMQRELNNIKSNDNNYVGYISVNSSF